MTDLSITQEYMICTVNEKRIKNSEAGTLVKKMVPYIDEHAASMLIASAVAAAI